MLLAIQILTARPAAGHLTLTELVHRFRATGSVRVLLQLIVSIVKQRRAVEVVYGAWCSMVHPPSTVHPPEDPESLERILRRKAEFARHAVLFRGQLLQLYGETAGIRDLPVGFASVRRHSVWPHDGRLILGEYGEGARLACITGGSCVISDHYRHMPGVRHIHAIQGYGGNGRFLVCTGDGHKFLDLWVSDEGGIRFVRRLRRRLAGYTAAAEVAGEYWFGTDFSGRPNFIQLLGGPKYFFPEQAYTMHAAAFHVLFDRYIVSVNKELNLSGGRRALCVFDTRARRFVHCDYMPA